ncbi:hypothetical protein [Flavobacterium sp.]|uniref:hypothetical protein n=1 Tax=Flavobacterium sp. TaxID=239 RepID=UPI0035274175
MRKAIVYILIITFLCANTAVGQLFKIPNLLEHYKEHKKDTTTNSISFTTFLKLHYSKTSKEHHGEHHDLPFKTFDNNGTVLFAISLFKLQIEMVKTMISCKNKFFYNISIKSSLIKSIWLPPKIATI